MKALPTLIERVREHYLRQFLDFVRIQRAEWVSGSPEVKFELTSSSTLYRSLYAVDFAGKVGSEAIVREMQPDLILEFEPFTTEVRGVPIRLEQLVWDDVELHHDARDLSPHGLKRWFDHWFDPDEIRYNADAEVGCMIHSLFVEQGHLSLDLGTATVDAFWDALDLILDAGASNVRVNSSRDSVVS